MSLVRTLFAFAIALSLVGSVQAESTQALDEGAVIYKKRCMLCHGAKGMGEGILPLSIEGYPSTNIKIQKHGGNLDSIIDAVRYGGSDNTKFSPPWIGEISDDDISKVSRFVQLLQEDSIEADRILRKNISSTLPLRNGRVIYFNRCSICHGNIGEGDGRLARLFQSPPPTNLVTSRADLNAVKKIISQGGEAIQRSPNMPPWEDELIPEQIDAVTRYIMSLRQVGIE